MDDYKAADADTLGKDSKLVELKPATSENTLILLVYFKTNVDIFILHGKTCRFCLCGLLEKFKKLSPLHVGL